MAYYVGLFPVCEGAVYANGGVGAAMYPLIVLGPASVRRPQQSTSANQSTGPVVTTPTRGGKGSRPHVPRVKEPAPGSPKGKEAVQAAAKKGKEPAQAAAKKGKEPAQAAAKKGKAPAQAAAKKGKEPAQAAARKTKEPAPAGRKSKGPGAVTVMEPPPPTMVVKQSEVAGEGAEACPHQQCHHLQ
ncbi:hypothetical protein NDU88_005362 [Pleurodeles waltl]|uniref:Uncharacterized protein n=1 Tax=Pleurodeles waltl TaxID=8319 RepID=A0AAV7TU52_PLEWA|nr:hypothetical protein NDU88_005362 [Pleurodeles waltl]